MPFNSHLDTRAHAPGEFVLLSDFRYRFRIPGLAHTCELTVPRGFVTDFASVPWAVQALPGFHVNGSSRFAAIPHDWLYCNQGRVKVGLVDEHYGHVTQVVAEEFTRAECDAIFRQALLDTGRDFWTLAADTYSAAQAALFHAGVRVGGWYYWWKRREGIRFDYDFAELD